jgi:hypothetical protein
VKVRDDHSWAGSGGEYGAWFAHTVEDALDVPRPGIEVLEIPLSSIRRGNWRAIS